MITGINCDKITCVKNIETRKAVPTKTVLTKSTSTNLCVLLAFLLITIALFIAVSPVIKQNQNIS